MTVSVASGETTLGQSPSSMKVNWLTPNIEASAPGDVTTNGRMHRLFDRYLTFFLLFFDRNGQRAAILTTLWFCALVLD